MNSRVIELIESYSGMEAKNHCDLIKLICSSHSHVFTSLCHLAASLQTITTTRYSLARRVLIHDSALYEARFIKSSDKLLCYCEVEFCTLFRVCAFNSLESLEWSISTSYASWFQCIALLPTFVKENPTHLFMPALWCCGPTAECKTVSDSEFPHLGAAPAPEHVQIILHKTPK